MANIQISGLPSKNTLAGTDVFPIDSNGVTYKITGAAIAEGLESIGNYVTGVKGNSESTYRTGDVNITKANIGLGDVDNTSDANKPVSTATQAALDALQAAILANFAGEFDAATAYTAGTYVTYTDGFMYVLPNGHEADVTWANTTKTKVTTGEELSNLKVAVYNAALAADAAMSAATLAGRNNVKYSSQTLDDTQKAQARTNIGAISRTELDAAISTTMSNFAGAFVVATAYPAGTYVTYTDGFMYVLPDGHDADVTWANTTKTKVTTGKELSDLKSAIDAYMPIELYNKNALTSEYYYSSTGSLIHSSSWNYTPLISLSHQNGDKFKYSGYTITSATAARTCFFDSNQDYIENSAIALSTGENELTIPAGAAYVAFSVNNNDIDSFSFVKQYLPMEFINGINARAIANESDIEELETENNGIKLFLHGTDVTPSSIQSGKAYFSTTDTIIDANGFVLKEFTVEANKKYYVTSSLYASSAGFPIIAYFDNNGDVISYEYVNESNVTISITQQLITIPAGAIRFYVNSRAVESVVETVEVSNSDLHNTICETSGKKVSILFVGNSLTQDGISYLPYLLKTYYPDILFDLYMWYIPSYTLGEQYTAFVNNTPCHIFSVAENTIMWTNYSDSKTMQDVLSTYKFDIVCLQEHFNTKASYTDADIADWNNCRDYITVNYTGGNALEFISLFSAPKRDGVDTVFNLAELGNSMILQKTIADDMIPNGIAVYRALDTALDSLGDQGHLSPDGIHTQEGLPCLLQTFVTACWLFNRLGLPCTIYGSTIRMTTDIYNMLNVPGANLGTGVITGTDAQNILAQEVAIKAYKEGKRFVIDNLFSET